MKILALEFSTPHRTAALFDIQAGAARMIASVTEATPANERHRLSPFVLLDQLFKDFDRSQIEGIAVGLGPGSYTGIRSSLAIAQGWNLAKQIPAAGVSSADAIALSATHLGHRGDFEIIIDAQRGEVYSALYTLQDEDAFIEKYPLQILTKPQTVNPIGPDATRFCPKATNINPSAWAIGKLAARLPFISPELLEPIYLREPTFVKAPAPRHT